MKDAVAIKRLKAVYATLRPMMDERMRRHWAAAEAQAYGWGGIRAVSTATGLSPTTIRRGVEELSERRAHPDLAHLSRGWLALFSRGLTLPRRLCDILPSDRAPSPER